MKSIFSLKTILFLFLSIIFVIAIVALCNLWVMNATQNRMYHKLSDIPVNDIGLVLGTNPKIRNTYENPYFTKRINAAYELYTSGKVKHLLLSGDNGRNEYNEPEEMQKALLKKGVPASAMTLDFAGFRTLDSVVRSKKVFQQKKITILSQEFHNYRALFIAKHFGLEAVAYNAKAVNSLSKKAIYREYLARVKVVIDLFITRLGPKFLGEKIDIQL